MASLPKKSLLIAFGLLMSAGTVAAQESPWQFRVRGIGVVPNESATITTINGDVEISNAIVPELDITYFLNQNVSLELILATAQHDVTAVGTALGEVDLGSVWLLPPTLLLQYHLSPEGAIRPYVGAGGNLTFFYGDDVPGDVVTDADYSATAGFALQAGVDIPIGDGRWFLNLDAKRLFLETDVALNDASILADVTIDPWIVGAGFGIRLGN